MMYDIYQKIKWLIYRVLNHVLCDFILSSRITRLVGLSSTRFT
jgi:uncharacterized membrane protein YkvI